LAGARPTIGESIGSYALESLLAEGSMSRVYKARDPEGEAVAVKLVRASLGSDSSLRRRFERETKIGGRLNHSHVVPFRGAGEYDGMPFVAFKFLSGGSLEQRIAREVRLGLDVVVRLCLEIASGLDALHDAGLVHRNLKPSNIVFDEEGSAYIADFAFAKDRDASMLTLPGQALGSQDYMAPEQIRGEPATAAADVYALGCVICECISGKPPFGDREGMNALFAHLQDAPPDSCAGRDDVPEDVGWAINRALEKDPDRRPPNATAYARMVYVAAGSPPLS
jgi:serine/threonine protein kinase